MSRVNREEKPNEKGKGGVSALVSDNLIVSGTIVIVVETVLIISSQ